MTIVAGIAAGNMCGMLALRNIAVVTGKAGADDGCVVDTIDYLPCSRVVAVIARISGSDVVHGFLVSGKARCLGVTGDTSFRSALEYALQMTALARRFAMAAKQVVTGGQMIESAGHRRGCMGICSQEAGNNTKSQQQDSCSFV